MKRKERPRSELREFLVLASLGLAGLASLVMGLELLKGRAGPAVGGLLLLAGGVGMLVAAGYYHYRRDYRGKGKHPAIAFIAIAGFSALAGLVATGLFFGG